MGEGDRDPIVLIVLFHKFTLKEILFSAMVPILVLLLPSLAWGQTKCGPYTTNDMLGPYFEENAPKDKELAPPDELNDPSQFVILEGQVLNRGCQGVSGALVKATYPRIYQGRAIKHYHFKVTAEGKEFVTQAYFKGEVPPKFEDMVKGRESQFPKVEAIAEGRRVTMDIRLSFC